AFGSAQLVGRSWSGNRNLGTCRVGVAGAWRRLLRLEVEEANAQKLGDINRSGPALSLSSDGLRADCAHRPFRLRDVPLLRVERSDLRPSSTRARDPKVLRDSIAGEARRATSDASPRGSSVAVADLCSSGSAEIRPEAQLKAHHLTLCNDVFP